MSNAALDSLDPNGWLRHLDAELTMLCSSDFRFIEAANSIISADPGWEALFSFIEGRYIPVGYRYLLKIYCLAVIETLRLSGKSFPMVTDAAVKKGIAVLLPLLSEPLYLMSAIARVRVTPDSSPGELDPLVVVNSGVFSACSRITDTIGLMSWANIVDQDNPNEFLKFLFWFHALVIYCVTYTEEDSLFSDVFVVGEVRVLGPILMRMERYIN